MSLIRFILPITNQILMNQYFPWPYFQSKYLVTTVLVTHERRRQLTCGEKEAKIQVKEMVRT